MSDLLKIKLWQRATPVLGDSSDLWRYDHTGRLIYWDAYGNRNHPNGWEAGHIIAKADGGADSWFNLQAEHWQTNLDKEQARKNVNQAGLLGLSALPGLTSGLFPGKLPK